MAMNLLLPFAGSALSAGASLLGAQMTSSSSAKASRLASIAQAYQNDIDRQINSQNFNASMGFAREQWERSLHEGMLDRELQREFAQNGVQWRVNDAEAAGIHPIAALGGQFSSPSPIQISGSVPQAAAASSNPLPPLTGSSMGAGLQSAGQDLSRAVSAVATEWERSQGVKTASEALTLENQSLQNQLLAAQLARTSGAAVGPPMPSIRSTNMIDGQGNTPSRLNTNLVSEKKHEPVVGAPGQKQSEPGEVTDVGYARTGTGYAPVPSKDVKERIEDNLVSELMWEARNRITQSLGFNLSPPKHVPLKSKDHSWYFNPLKQEYQQRIAPFDKATGTWRWDRWWNDK